MRDDALLATRELIRSRWFLGSRRVALGVRCHFDEAGHVLHYHEIAKEVSAGLPPPSFSVTMHRQRGLDVRETRRELSPFGGGTLEYGKVHEWLHTLCEGAGWALERDNNPCLNVDIRTILK